MSVAFSRTTRSLQADRGTRADMIVIAVAALFLAWSAWMLLGRVTVYATSRSARIEVADAPRTFSIGEGGRLLVVHVHAGEKVRAGTLIAEIEAEPQRLRLAEVEARLAAFPARIAALQAELDAARSAERAAVGASAAQTASARAHAREAAADAAYRKTAAERIAADAATGGSPASDADRARSEAGRAAALGAARREDERAAAHDGAARVADRAAGAAGIEEALSALRADQAALEAAAAQARYALAERNIRAPVDGTIGDLGTWRPGDMLPAGAKVATLVPDSALRVVADFDSAGNFGWLNPGQKAQIQLDGFSWVQFGQLDAAVSHVAAEARDGRLRVDLVLMADRASRLPLRHGMTGEVDVAIEQVAPVVLVLRAIGLLRG